MCLQVPIIAPVKQKKLEVLERAPLPTYCTNEFLAGLMTNPELVRNVAIAGHLHHGKTLVSQFSFSCFFPGNKFCIEIIECRQSSKQRGCIEPAVISGDGHVHRANA
jgi:hypothetical protein